MGQTDVIAPNPLPETNSVAFVSMPPTPLTLREHPWGRFQPGTWACYQTITETHRDGRVFRNLSETKTTLESTEPIFLTLAETATSDVGGKKVASLPVRKQFDFLQEQIDNEVKITQGPSSKLPINNQIIPCETRIYEQFTPSGKRTSTVWYSTQIYPYILRVERVLRSVPTEPNGDEKLLSQSTTEVVSTTAAQLWKSKLGEYRIRTIKKSGNMTTITESNCSRQKPGGMYEEKTKELDQNGKVIRTIETKLINYHDPNIVQGAVFQYQSQPTPNPKNVPQLVPSPFPPKLFEFCPTGSGSELKTQPEPIKIYRPFRPRWRRLQPNQPF